MNRHLHSHFNGEVGISLEAKGSPTTDLTIPSVGAIFSDACAPAVLPEENGGLRSILHCLKVL